MTLGVFLLSRMNEQTSVLMEWLWMLVLGLGLGLVFQLLVTVVQNAVEYRNLGAATSAATFFRSIGGYFGTAVFGAIFSNQLASHLSSLAALLGWSMCTVAIRSAYEGESGGFFDTEYLLRLQQASFAPGVLPFITQASYHPSLEKVLHVGNVEAVDASIATNCALTWPGKFHLRIWSRSLQTPPQPVFAGLP